MTRNIVPRSDLDSGLGTLVKRWLKGWFKDIYVSGDITDGTIVKTVAQMSLGWATTGDKVVKKIPISVVSASGITTSTATSLTSRGQFIVDIGNTAKWNSSRLGVPVITFSVVGRNQTAGQTATYDLYEVEGAASITGSTLTTTSAATNQILSVAIAQGNFPTTPKVVQVRTSTTATGTVDLACAEIELVWTVAA